MVRARRSKLTSYKGTITTRSGFETRQILDLEQREIAYSYESEKIDYLPIPKWRRYTPDIVLVKRDTSKMYIEIKGYFSTADRMKHLSIHRHDPRLDIRFVFQNAQNKIYKGSKTTYSDWCDKQGFRWANKRIPDEWIEELR